MREGVVIAVLFVIVVGTLVLTCQPDVEGCRVVCRDDGGLKTATSDAPGVTYCTCRNDQRVRFWFNTHVEPPPE